MSVSRLFSSETSRSLVGFVRKSTMNQRQRTLMATTLLRKSLRQRKVVFPVFKLVGQQFNESGLVWMVLERLKSTFVEVNLTDLDILRNLFE